MSECRANGTNWTDWMIAKLGELARTICFLLTEKHRKQNWRQTCFPKYIYLPNCGISNYNLFLITHSKSVGESHSTQNITNSNCRFNCLILKGWQSFMDFFHSFVFCIKHKFRSFVLNTHCVWILLQDKMWFVNSNVFVDDR